MQIENEQNTVIDQAVRAYDEIAATLHEQASALSDVTIANLFDDGGLKQAKSNLRSLKSLDSAIENKRKELKAIALEYGRAVDGRAKELFAISAPHRESLEAKIKAVEDEREAQRRKLELERIAKLTDAGYEFTGGFYRVGVKMIEPSQITKLSDEDFDHIVSQGAQERKRLIAELEALRVEQERIEAERAAMAAERAELEALRRANDEAKRVEEPAPIAPAVFAPPKPQRPMDYERGFNACKSLVLAILVESETYKTRPQIIQGITALDAHN
jgi:hypothetical protein